MDFAPYTAQKLNWLRSPPSRVSVYEVGPRDGLQNEARVLSVEDKVRLIEALVAAGEKRIEATSFVSPKWIPQLADAEAVMAKLPRVPGVQYSALVPNLKGLERAIGVGMTEVAVFLSVTESHSKKNINKSVAEAIATAAEVTQAALKQNIRVRCYLSTVWGCPYEGMVPVERVVDVVKKLNTFGVYQISLGDTIGVGTPGQTERILNELLTFVPVDSLALHLHDTRGTALANALVGLSMGISTFDSSVGGLGGCPYAPGAAGNLPTEDFVYLLEGLGIPSGIDLSKLVDAGSLAESMVKRKLNGKYYQAAIGARERAGNG